MLGLKCGRPDADSLIELQDDTRHSLAGTGYEANTIAVPTFSKESCCQSCLGLAVLIQKWWIDYDSVELPFQLGWKSQGVIVIIELEIWTDDFKSLVVL